jgi:hypothetical protein
MYSGKMMEGYKNSVPQTLLKFMPVSDYSLRMLQGGMHFSSVDNFHDPYEGIFKESGTLTEERKDALVKENLIFSCSHPLTFNSPLMWGQYTENHRGICIEFDSAVITGEPFDGRFVNYSVRSPKLEKIQEGGRVQCVMSSVMFNKEKSWSHEMEYRVLMPRSYYGNCAILDERFEPTNNGLLFQAPFGFIKKVYLGCRISAEAKQAVIEAIKNYSTCMISEVGVVKSKYRLTNCQGAMHKGIKKNCSKKAFSDFNKWRRSLSLTKAV